MCSFMIKAVCITPFEAILLYIGAGTVSARVTAG